MQYLVVKKLILWYEVRVVKCGERAQGAGLRAQGASTCPAKECFLFDSYVIFQAESDQYGIAFRCQRPKSFG